MRPSFTKPSPVVLMRMTMDTLSLCQIIDFSDFHSFKLSFVYILLFQTFTCSHVHSWIRPSLTINQPIPSLWLGWGWGSWKRNMQRFSNKHNFCFPVAKCHRYVVCIRKKNENIGVKGLRGHAFFLNWVVLQYILSTNIKVLFSNQP